jgi:flagellar FliL protein
MAAVIADPAPAGGAVPVKRGKKKLLILVAAVLAVVLAVGGGGVWFLKKRAAHAAAEAASDEGGGAEAEHAAGKIDAKTPPTYLPLDPFVINLADKEADRYAQIGITLEVESPAFAEQMKGYMPAVRNAILMIIAHKTAKDLLGRAGKEELADEIMREAVRPMGIEIAAPAPVLAQTEGASAVAPAPGASAVVAVAQDEAASSVKKAKRKSETTHNPVQHVHFSSFIIQ